MLKDDLEKSLAYLKSEFSKLRAGRASIDMVENIAVDAYNSKMPLKQLATLSSPEPRLIIVQPWDKSIIKNIENALRSALSGISPVVDSEIIRLSFPAPTEENRRDLVKEVKRIVEETKIQIRQARENTIQELRLMEEKKEISEDELFRKKDETQKTVDLYNKLADNMGRKKEEEIMAI
jgi:ribosome recycling factor